MGTITWMPTEEIPSFWTADGETWFAYEKVRADPDLKRRCLAWELAQVGRALSRTDHEPAFGGIRLAVLEAAEEIGVVDELRELMRVAEAARTAADE